jgi:predicted  nucleic acid-binding Zn-ribbon protein
MKGKKILTCKRCGHIWKPRKEKLPKACPKCRNPYWNKIKQDKLVSKYIY